MHGRPLRPLCAVRGMCNYGPWVVEYLLEWLLRAPEKLRQYHFETAFWRGEAMDKRQEEVQRRLGRCMASWITSAFEMATMFVNSGTEVHDMILREHRLWKDKPFLRTPTQLEEDTLIIECRLASYRTYRPRVASTV
jgi:hypothetical protein